MQDAIMPQMMRQAERDACARGLDRNPQAMRLRRETAEHPFGTLKMRMGATHFLTKCLPKVATEMSDYRRYKAAPGSDPRIVADTASGTLTATQQAAELIPGSQL